MGVFHPHERWRHIKKENIGLIEVMDLAVLPPRLVPELDAVKRHLLVGDLSGLSSDQLSSAHAAWAEDIYLHRGDELREDNALDILHEEVVKSLPMSWKTPASSNGTSGTGRSACGRFIDGL